MIGTIRILACVATLSLCAVAARAERLGFAGSVTWFGQVPIMVAIDKGFFKEQGIDVEYQVLEVPYGNVTPPTTRIEGDDA